MSRQHYIRFFISSTFADMERERDWLAQIFQRLGEEYQREKGWQVEYVDLRWGIPESAGRDNRTMSICKDELRHCQQLSPRPNFIVLLGERYGWIPLPEAVPDSIGRLLNNFTNLFSKYYRQDFNNVAYYKIPRDPKTGKLTQQRMTDYGPWILKPFGDIDPDIRTKEVEEPLRKCFEGVVMGMSLWSDSKGIVTDLNSSATEQEIYYGALSVKDADQHVVGYCRKLRDVPTGNVNVYYDNENVGRMISLRNKLKSQIAKDKLLECDIFYSDYIGDAYAKHFTQEMERRIRMVIDAEIERTAAKEPTLLDRELQRQKFYREEKSSQMIGRSDEVQILKSFVIDECDKSSLWITGPAGIGKSTFAANVPTFIWSKNRLIDERTRINAFYVRCNLTQFSSTAIGILDLIYADMYKYYKNLFDEKYQSTFRPAIYSADYKVGYDNRKWQNHHIYRLLSRISQKKSRPVVIVIDGLDLLPIKEWERLSKLFTRKSDWRVKLVLTQENLPYEGRSDIKLDEKQMTHLELHPLCENDAKNLINSKLKKHHRQLSTEQQSHVDEELAQMVRTGTNVSLYGYYLSSFVYSWTPAVELPRHDDNILLKIINTVVNLRHHDPHLVFLSLSIITTTKGVNDRELIDILSLDSQLQKTFENTSQHKWTDERRLPPFFWHRLSHDLGEIIGYANTVYGEVNQVCDRNLSNDIWQLCQKTSTPEGITYTQLAVRLQYKYYYDLWIKGNRRAIYDLPQLTSLYYGTNSKQGFVELENLAHDMRFTSQMTELYGTHVDSLFNLIISNDFEGTSHFKTPAERRIFFQKLRNWLLSHTGLSSYQIQLSALAEPDDSPAKQCEISESIRQKSLNNILRNNTGKDSVVFRPTFYEIEPIGLSSEAKRIVYLEKEKLITFDRQNWKRLELVLPSAAAKTCADKDACIIGILHADNSITVFDTVEQRKIISFTCGETKIDHITLSHDGHLLAFTHEQYLYIWNITDRQWVCQDSMMEKICSIAFSDTDKTLWVLFSRHAYPFFLENPGEKAWHIPPLHEDVKSTAIIMAAHDNNILFTKPFMTAIFDINERNANCMVFTALSNRMAGGGIECALANEDGSFTVSMEGLMWNVSVNQISNPRNVPAFKHMTPNARFGMTECGIVYDIEGSAHSYQVNTGTDEYGILHLGVSSVSASINGAWMVVTPGNDPLREQQIHIFSAIINDLGNAETMITVPPYTDVYEGQFDTIAAAVAPDSSVCAFTQNGSNNLRLLLTDNKIHRQRMIEIPKEQLNLQTNSMRSLVWTVDSRFLIGAVWHHVADSYPHIHIFNRQGDYIRSIVYDDLVMPTRCTPILSSNNRYAARVLWGDGILISDLDSGEHHMALTNVSKDLNKTIAFHPAKCLCFSSAAGKLYSVSCSKGGFKESIITDNVKCFLALSPSGRFVYIKEIEEKEYLTRIDLSNLSRKRYTLEIKQVASTINDQFIYVRTKNDDILLVDADNDQILQEMHVQVSDDYMISTRLGLFVVDTSGTPMMLSPQKTEIVYNTGVVCSVLRWNLEKRSYDKQPTTVCPHCGKVFTEPLRARDVTECPYCRGNIIYAN